MPHRKGYIHCRPKQRIVKIILIAWFNLNHGRTTRVAHCVRLSCCGFQSQSKHFSVYANKHYVDALWNAYITFFEAHTHARTLYAQSPGVYIQYI